MVWGTDSQDWPFEYLDAVIHNTVPFRQPLFLMKVKGTVHTTKRQYGESSGDMCRRTIIYLFCGHNIQGKAHEEPFSKLVPQPPLPCDCGKYLNSIDVQKSCPKCKGLLDRNSAPVQGSFPLQTRSVSRHSIPEPLEPEYKSHWSDSSDELPKPSLLEKGSYKAKLSMKKIVGSIRRGTGKDKQKSGDEDKPGKRYMGEERQRIDTQGTRNRDVEEFYATSCTNPTERSVNHLAGHPTSAITVENEALHPVAIPRDIALPAGYKHRKDRNIDLETTPIWPNLATNPSSVANPKPRRETRWFPDEAGIRQGRKFIDSPQAMKSSWLSREDGHETQYVDEPLMYDDRASFAHAMNFVPQGTFSDYASIVDEVQTDVFQKDKQQPQPVKIQRSVQIPTASSHSLPYRPVLESKLRSGVSKEVLTAAVAAGARRSQDRERKEVTFPHVVEERPSLPKKTNTYPQQATRTRPGIHGWKEANYSRVLDERSVRVRDGRGGWG